MLLQKYDGGRDPGGAEVSWRWVMAGAAVALLLGLSAARLWAARPYESAFSIKVLPAVDAGRIVPQIFHLLQQPEMLGNRMILTRRIDEREFEVRVLCPKADDAAENAKLLKQDVMGAEMEPDRVVRMLRLEGACINEFTSQFLQDRIREAEAAFRKAPGPATRAHLNEVTKLLEENAAVWRRRGHLEVTRQPTRPQRVALGEWVAIRSRAVVGW